MDNIASYFETNVSEAMCLVRAQASGYRSKKNETVEKIQLLQIAAGIISEYIPPNVLKLLKDTYGSELNNTFIIKHSAQNSAEGDLYDDARYGKIVEKRKIGISSTVETPKPKKRKIKAHEKVDTRKIASLSLFFSK